MLTTIIDHNYIRPRSMKSDCLRPFFESFFVRDSIECLTR
jgi:hypothetical protein